MMRKWHKRAKKKESAPAPEPEKKESAPAPEPETEPKPAAVDSEGFTTNQWLTILGIGATLLTTYVKHDDIKAFFGKKQDNPPELEPVVTILKSPPQPRKGIRHMD